LPKSPVDRARGPLGSPCGHVHGSGSAHPRPEPRSLRAIRDSPSDTRGRPRSASLCLLLHHGREELLSDVHRVHHTSPSRPVAEADPDPPSQVVLWHQLGRAMLNGIAPCSSLVRASPLPPGRSQRCHISPLMRDPFFNTVLGFFRWSICCICQ